MSVVYPPAPAFTTDSPILREMLANAVRFGEPVHKSSFAPGAGVREVLPGARSPPPSRKRTIDLPPFSSSSASIGLSQNEGDDSSPSRPRPLYHSQSQAEAGPSTPIAKSSSTIQSRPASAGPSTPATHATPNGKGKARDASAGANVTPGKGGPAYNAPLYEHITDLTWPEPMAHYKRPAAGLYNPSMACYANATLQVIMHTPPVLRIAQAHNATTCLKNKRGFCMLCALRDMAEKQHWTKAAYQPKEVHSNLGQLKKGFNKNRQEDTHEFFRFVTDALQATALAALPKDLSHKIKNTSWVHRVWGGVVRSRVVCGRCQKPSDTFDTFLDLSLDVAPGKKSLGKMLDGFTKEDRLEGENKYNCENCKTKSVATKGFRIAEAPPILTLHLKRFSVNYNSYNGKPRADKFNQMIEYPEFLDIAPYMIDRNMGGTQYRLFGVTCHRGAELRFGHYTSYVRSPLGRWYQADDEDMSPVPLQQVISDKTAYLLSYIRVDGFESAQAQAHAQSRRESVGGQSNAKASPAVNGHASPVKRKRPLQEDSEDDGEDDNGDEDEDENGDRPTKRGVPNGRYPSPAAPPSTPPRAPSPKLFSSAFDTPASETISSDNHATGLDSLPTKFGYQPKPKPKQQLQQSQQSQPVNILAPRPIPSKSFYGHEPSTTSPIARPGHPSPFAERADKHMSKKQRKKASKKELRKQRREDSRAGGGGAPKPYAVMHGGGNGGLGFASKKKGVVDRMQPKKRAL